jgi:DNA-directed RNA polymerase delta subunit
MQQSVQKFMQKEKDDIVIVKTQICRNKKNPMVFNKIVKKQYSMVYDKRRVLSNYTSVPFGFKN